MVATDIRALLEDGAELTAEQIISACGLTRRSALEALRVLVRDHYVSKRLDESKKDRHGRPVAYFKAADPDEFPRMPVEQIVASALKSRHPLEQVWRV